MCTMKPWSCLGGAGPGVAQWLHHGMGADPV